MLKKLISVIVFIGILINTAVISFGQEDNTLLDSMTNKSGVLMEQSTGKILLSKNALEKTAPASITKIMTMLLIIEAVENGNVSLDDMITTSANAKIMGGSEIFLAEGEEMSLDDMLKGIAVASANDAAVAVAEYLCGTEEIFVDKMNKKAEELKLKNTHYVNCHGLDEENHYTCAEDVAILTRELMKHEKIKEYTTIWMDSLRGGETELVNTNRLIRFYKGATGLKTGTTEAAGHCLSATAQRDGLELIAVVMNCPTGKDRFSEASSLLDYGFSHYSRVFLPKEMRDEYEIMVLGGEKETVRGRMAAPESLIMEKDNKNNLEVKINLKESVTAPIEENEILGTAELLQNGECIGIYYIKSSEIIEKRSLLSSINLMWRCFVRQG